MGQGELLAIMRNRPDHWFNSTELAALTGMTRDNINRTLRTLRRYNEVAYRELACCKIGNKRRYEYRWKQ